MTLPSVLAIDGFTCRLAGSPPRSYIHHKTSSLHDLIPIAHGLVPTHFDRLERRARSRDPSLRPAAQTQLASVYAALGLYERAAALDERLLAADPRSVPAARRRLWSLLHQDRGAESLEAAERLAAIAPPGDGLARLLGDAARHRAALPDGRAEAVVAPLPVFTRSEGQRLLIGIRQPEARLRGR